MRVGDITFSSSVTGKVIVDLKADTAGGSIGGFNMEFPPALAREFARQLKLHADIVDPPVPANVTAGSPAGSPEAEKKDETAGSPAGSPEAEKKDETAGSPAASPEAEKKDETAGSPAASPEAE